MEVEYLHSKYSLSLLNIASKHGSLQAKNLVYSFNLQPLGGKNVHENLLTPNDENSVLAIDLQTVSTEYGHETRVIRHQR